MLCTQDIIFTLHPVPWDQQVTELLKQKKVSEALELAKYAHKTSLTPEEQRDVSFRPINYSIETRRVGPGWSRLATLSTRSRI